MSEQLVLLKEDYIKQLQWIKNFTKAVGDDVFIPDLKCLIEETNKLIHLAYELRIAQGESINEKH